MTVGEWCRSAERRLARAGVSAARLEAQVLAGHVLRVDRSWLLAHPDHEFNNLAGEALLQRREAGEPLAYIVGRREFYRRCFLVGPGVLVPRTETETLVEAALAIGLPRSARVLDIGTGSGCVGITLKLERPEWAVTLLDLSDDALRIAEANAATLGAEVRLVRANLLPPAGEGFDAIVTNPPYVATGDPLPREIREFEPPMALFAGDDGLDVYRRLAKEAGRALAMQGLLLTEVGDHQADRVVDTFADGCWTLVAEWKDLDGIRRVLAFAPPSRLPVP
ncbi:MAG: peptide chain release factor N(5)-glutamine methyltransferase [Fimbriimonadaceae bacterium]|nr:peptide chain release factor N(5)-glutamine methyltransferase [Fimbriimonadaceae bacterium]